MRAGLRLAFFAQDFPPEVGGTHVYNVEFATRLAGFGHDVKLFTWKSHATPEGEDASDASMPFEVHRQPYLRPGRSIDPRGVEEAIGRWRSDVAFVSGGSGAVSAVVHAAAGHVPTVTAVHDLRDKGSRRGRLGRWRVRRRYGFDRAARITANSEHTRGCLLRLGVDAAKLALVHPGVDTRAFTPDPESGARLRRERGLEGRPMLLTVARLASNKGHARVIEALPALRRTLPDVVYAVVGGGGTRARLESRAADLGVADAVLFAGRVSDVRPWYNACDVFVMASTPTGRQLKAGEGFGMAYVEAGACGKPVVASSSGGGSEVVIPGETGLVVAPDDDPGLEAALDELLGDPARARALGEKALDHVQRWDWSRGVVELDRVLREAAEATPEERP